MIPDPSTDFWALYLIMVPIIVVVAPYVYYRYLGGFRRKKVGVQNDE